MEQGGSRTPTSTQQQPSPMSAGLHHKEGGQPGWQVGKWPNLHILLQCTLPHTTLHRTLPTPSTLYHPPRHPSPTNPSPPFTLRHPPRHPSPTCHAAPHQAHRGGTAHPCPTPYATRHPHPRPPHVGMETQCTHTMDTRRRGGVYMMRSPQGGPSAGKNRQKVGMCPWRGICPACGHPGAQKPPLGRGPTPFVDAPPERPMGTTTYGGKGSKGTAANGDRPIGATSYK